VACNIPRGIKHVRARACDSHDFALQKRASPVGALLATRGSPRKQRPGLRWFGSSEGSSHRGSIIVPSTTKHADVNCSERTSCCCTHSVMRSFRATWHSRMILGENVKGAAGNVQ
jgi:hypothetical protein